MIKIQKSTTADTRTCDFKNVTKEQLLESTKQHIVDVGRGLDAFRFALIGTMIKHDSDKITDIDHFHSDFITGFKETGWWENHKKVTRHHLFEDAGVPDNVNLLDVLELIVDCVMAGMGRVGEVYPLDLDQEVLMKAFQNTVELLKEQVVVEKD